MPTRCHRRKRADDLGVVSGRFVWDVNQLQIRLRDELSPRAWRLLSAAANRAGTDVEGLLQQHLQEAR